MKFLYSSSHWGRIVRFSIGGGSAAALNLILAYVGIELLGLHTDLQQNFVNVATMEICLVYSFFVYRTFVWRDKGSSVSRIFFRQLPIYHMSAGAGLLSRTVLFPILDAFGVYYLLNIALGILFGAGLNYILSNQYVFSEARGDKPL